MTPDLEFAIDAFAAARDRIARGTMPGNPFVADMDAALGWLESLRPEDPPSPTETQQ